MKKIICEKIKAFELEGVYDMIEEYEAKFPYDFEIYSIKSSYYFALGDYKSAESVLLKGLSVNRFNFEIVYNLALVYEMMYDAINQNKYLHIAYTISTLPPAKGEEDYSEYTSYIKEKLSKFSYYCSIEEEKKNYTLNQIQENITSKLYKHLNQIKFAFFYLNMDAWSHKGDLYFNDYLRYDNRYYVANFSRTGVDIEDTKYYRKVEVFKIADDEYDKEKNTIKISQECILPICSKDYKPIILEYKGKDFEFHKYKSDLSYLKVDSDVKLKSGDVIFGKPIKLQSDNNKKKLVMTIFVDGLSQTILEKYGFENLMPHTYKYFKNSIYFTNCYSIGEWTYPSMAGYFTGFYTTRHKMYTNPLVNTLPDDTKLLGEILSDAGYICSKIDGDWRTNPDMGYIRGFNRYIYGKYCEVMDSKDVIMEAIDNIELFKDTNQYLFINISELHDIADYYKLKPSVQADIDIDNSQTFEYITTTSVLIQHDYRKEIRYINQIKYVDRQLNILYNYIKDLFEDDDVVISLFSDHGQGYILDDSGFFLADERAKVPLMIKTGKDRVICDEYVSTIDYLNIMDNILNLGADLSDKDGNLPKFLGADKKRDFVFTESIHPDRLYRACIRNEDFYFTFETVEYVRNDGRVYLDDYIAMLMDKDGNVIEIDDKKKEYIDYVFDHMKEYRIYR